MLSRCVRQGEMKTLEEIVGHRAGKGGMKDSLDTYCQDGKNPIRLGIIDQWPTEPLFNN